MPETIVCTSGLAALNVLDKDYVHAARVTPPAQTSTWLPWVNIAISNLKRFLIGTIYGVSAKYLQEYLEEFCHSYRLNRLAQLPLRLLNACVTHLPAKVT